MTRRNQSSFLASFIGRYNSRSLMTSTAVSVVVFSAFFHFVFLPHWEIYRLKTAVENLGGQYDQVHDVMWAQPSVRVTFRNVPLTRSQIEELLPHLKRNPPHVLQLTGAGLSDQELRDLMDELDRKGSHYNVLVGETILSAREIRRINHR